MRKLLILADDLSGAADCASACVSYGLRAVVSFNELKHHLDSEVLSIDCNTRPLSPTEAAARITRVMQSSHLRPSERILFKKVDSTLRGNIASELKTVLAERRVNSPYRIVAIMAPAFPAGGRTTVDGHQLVHGIPLEKTEIWLHNDRPGVAHLPSMLGDAGLSTALLSLRIVRSDFVNLRSSMLEFATAADVIVCDAETDDDLGAIAHATVALGDDTVWVGSAGLAYQLPPAAGLSFATTSMQRPEFTSGPALLVVGSMSSVSHRQARALEDAIPVTSIRIPTDLLLEGHSGRSWAALAGRIHESLKSGKDTLIVVDPNGRVCPGGRHRLTTALRLLLAPHASLVGSLFATGGETARAILEGWGISSLHMLGELEPGLPFSFGRIQDRALPILTKAGAFGNQDALISCWRFFTNLSRTSSCDSTRNLL
jgi:4-hydroxythreonine-4-phosphate dehydrogenase